MHDIVINTGPIIALVAATESCLGSFSQCLPPLLFPSACHAVRWIPKFGPGAKL